MSNRRDAVHAVLQQSEGFRSAQDVYAEMRAEGAKIGLTTVYRALQALAETGRVDTLRTDDGESVYRACASGHHHHHLVCRKCGRTVEVAGPAVERWAEAVGTEHGFTEITHTVEVFGTCAGCSTTAEPSGSPGAAGAAGSA
ncbi:Fur family ferric uptake transcriptional regulator [Streptosporangium becharense]|uniref:Fur family ferric uptake transcriptional regulator n=1 Tax=Streptosporangium becharense TaxID=1816182 RepID=A0A7W9IDF7_9ACTN|nr:transcriptional repressor [Streptosporangium becharense]MBB2912123.1 Fur family ferric uptake transcriptional regulator [Streptosporangium becharense]MBB5818670.1 Fur family ferric uptake transcriptional regulator [Streptosporangium becharense]